MSHGFGDSGPAGATGPTGPTGGTGPTGPTGAAGSGFVATGTAVLSSGSVTVMNASFTTNTLLVTGFIKASFAGSVSYTPTAGQVVFDSTQGLDDRTVVYAVISF